MLKANHVLKSFSRVRSKCSSSNQQAHVAYNFELFQAAIDSIQVVVSNRIPFRRPCFRNLVVFEHFFKNWNQGRGNIQTWQIFNEVIPGIKSQNIDAVDCRHNFDLAVKFNFLQLEILPVKRRPNL